MLNVQPTTHAPGLDSPPHHLPRPHSPLPTHFLFSPHQPSQGFAKHKIPYQQVEGGVVPVLAHKFFETDLPFGLVTFKDIALMCSVPTPMIDAIILWNQKLIDKVSSDPSQSRSAGRSSPPNSPLHLHPFFNQVYLTEDGRLEGANIDECIVPSRMGFDLSYLTAGGAEASDEPPSKKAKA